MFFGCAGGAWGCPSLFNVTLRDIEISDTVHTIPLVVRYTSNGGHLILENIFGTGGGVPATTLYDLSNSYYPSVIVTQAGNILDVTAGATLAFSTGNINFPDLPYTYYFDGAQTWISGGTGTGPWNQTGTTDDVAPAAPANANEFTQFFDRTTGTLSWILNGGSQVYAVSRASTDTLTNKTLDVEGTGNVITTVQKMWLQAVNCTGTTPSLNWDTIATLAPATACTAGTTNTGLIRGLASFSNAEISQMQTHFKLPGDWAGAIDLKFKWQTSATSGSVVWQAASICVADAEVDDVAWNTASTVTDVAKGTTLQTNDASITGLTTTGCAAGELLHLKVFRDPAHASDDLAAAADLIGVEVTTRRAQ
jgi:hypothetical protein